MFETSVSPPAPLNLDIEYQNADLWSLWGGANAPRAPPLVKGLLFCAVFIHISVRFCGIQTPAYAPLLESDLDKLVAWSQTWQINFLSSKCYALCYIQDSHW